MGIYHILPLGVSPGVVTSPLSYIGYQYKKGNIDFFGRDSNRENEVVKKTSGIVLFTTKKIFEGKLLEHECVDNQLDSRRGVIKTKSVKIIDVVKEFLRKDKDLNEMMNEGAKVYWLESRPSEFNFNLEQLLELFHYLSPIGKVGKEMWVNITGGTNVVNVALSMATALTGVTGRQYYTFVPQDDIKYLRPPEITDKFWCDIPVLKIIFDRVYEIILRVLSEIGAISATDLFELVQQECGKQNIFDLFQAKEDENRDIFKKNYLNKLDGWLTVRPSQTEIAISDNGKTFLKLIDNPLVQSFLYKKPLDKEPNQDLLQKILL